MALQPFVLVRCLSCGHHAVFQDEIGISLPEATARLVCSKCGRRNISAERGDRRAAKRWMAR